jgi:hypothetical protein
MGCVFKPQRRPDELVSYAYLDPTNRTIHFKWEKFRTIEKISEIYIRLVDSTDGKWLPILYRLDINPPSGDLVYSLDSLDIDKLTKNYVLFDLFVYLSHDVYYVKIGPGDWHSNKNIFFTKSYE